MALDPDDPRPPFQQVASALRAGILTKKYRPGDRLPTGAELARQYGVARMTVQNALGLLRDEGLVVSRQGSGVFVRERTERPVGLRPHIEQAFAEAQVTIDFAGFAGETLHGALQEPLDKIRSGRLTPESIAVRMLLPDPDRPWTVPVKADDLEDDPAVRRRMHGIMVRHVGAIVDSVTELQDLGLVKAASAEVRSLGTPPYFKIYVLNAKEVFFGFYPVQKHRVTIGGEHLSIYDLVGKDTILFHHSRGDEGESLGSQYVEQSVTWFESVWNTVGRELGL